MQLCLPAQPSGMDKLTGEIRSRTSSHEVYFVQTAVSGNGEPIYESTVQLLPDGLFPYLGQLVAAGLSAPRGPLDQPSAGTLWFLWRPLDLGPQKLEGWTPWLRPLAVTGNPGAWSGHLLLEASLPVPSASPLMRFRIISAAQQAEFSALRNANRPGPQALPVSDEVLRCAAP